MCQVVTGTRVTFHSRSARPPIHLSFEYNSRCPLFVAHLLPPHNIFLQHKEHRVFKRRGETKIRISKTPEPVYYHPLRSCVPSVSSMNIKLEESVVTRLSDSNKAAFVV